MNMIKLSGEEIKEMSKEISKLKTECNKLKDDNADQLSQISDLVVRCNCEILKNNELEGKIRRLEFTIKGRGT